MKWKTGLAVLAAAMCIPAGSMAFDYNLSIDEISEHPLTAYNTVYLGMPKKDFALNFSILPDWTFYGSDGTTEKAERSVTQNGITVIEGLSITTADGSPRGNLKIISRRRTAKLPGICTPVCRQRFIPIWKISLPARAVRKSAGYRMMSLS